MKIEASTIETPRVRRVDPADADRWLDLRDALWPGSWEDHVVEIEVYFQDPPETETCLVAETAGQAWWASWKSVSVATPRGACRLPSDTSKGSTCCPSTDVWVWVARSSTRPRRGLEPSDAPRWRAIAP